MQSDRHITDLPKHVRDTVEAIAALHDEHRRGRTPLQRAAERIAAKVATPAFLAALLCAAAAWICLNLGLLATGRRALDSPPFFLLQGAASFSALLTSVTILIKQRREDELTELRQQLILELAILAEQKSAKTLERLEALRRALPDVEDDPDVSADALSHPADPGKVAEALQGSKPDAEVEATGRGSGAVRARVEHPRRGSAQRKAKSRGGG